MPNDKLDFCNWGKYDFLVWWGSPELLFLLALMLSSLSLFVWELHPHDSAVLIVWCVVCLSLDHLRRSWCWPCTLWDLTVIPPALWRSHGKLTLTRLLALKWCWPLFRLYFSWGRHWRNLTAGLCVWLHSRIRFLWRSPLNTLSTWRRGLQSLCPFWHNCSCHCLGSSHPSSSLTRWNLCLHTFGGQRIKFYWCHWWGYWWPCTTSGFSQGRVQKCWCMLEASMVSGRRPLPQYSLE